uniref:DNA-directed RNA polymerase n=1 Tax=Heterorhabditis bacteriophora TaxID=37862 RepID=A0A1I7WXC2_HETBA
MSKTDQVVMERRLRPIYDAIDSGNSKKAIQEAEKVLKKHPGAVCAKVFMNREKIMVKNINCYLMTISINYNYTTSLSFSINTYVLFSDDWTLWTLLFDSTFAMLKESVEEKNSKCIIDSLVSILGHEKFKTSKARGPHLAGFEFIGRMMTADEPIRSQLCTLQLGGTHRMIALSKALDIKSVQRDTLGHILFPMFELTGSLLQAMRCIDICLLKYLYLYSFKFRNWDLLGDNRDLTVIPSFEKDEVKKEIDEIRGSSQREFVDMTQLYNHAIEII